MPEYTKDDINNATEKDLRFMAGVLLSRCNRQQAVLTATAAELHVPEHKLVETAKLVYEALVHTLKQAVRAYVRLRGMA